MTCKETYPMPRPLPVSAHLPADRKALSASGLRTFFRIAEQWGLSAAEQQILLGVPSPSTFYKWKRDPQVSLPPDTLERISYILGIYKALQILLPDPLAADAWVRRPNDAPLFGGKPALERMLSGHVSDLYVVRQYLDAQRGGWA
jgi:hypothetical protein